MLVSRGQPTSSSLPVGEKWSGEEPLISWCSAPHDNWGHKELFRPVQKISLFPVAKVKKLESVGRQKNFFGVKLFGHKYTDVLQTASRQMPTAQRMASSLETRP